MAELLTQRDISEIHEAKVAQTGELEKKLQLQFFITLDSEEKSEWIGHSEISSSTLRSNLFKTFYQSVDSSISTAAELIDYLQTNQSSFNGSNNVNDSAESSPEPLDNSHCNEKVTIDFGDHIKSYHKDQLSQSSFFRSMFADRWQHQRNNNSSSSSNDDRQPIKLVAGFSYTSLNILLKCFHIGHIPYDLKPDIHTLERLIVCGDYLTSNEDNFVMNQGVIIDYLKNCIPRINGKQRKILFQQSSNDLMKSALNHLEQEMEAMMHEHRTNIVSNHTKLKLKNVLLDSETAAQLFIAKFKLEFVKRSSHMQIKIKDFSNKEEYFSLWRKRTYINNDYSIVTESAIPELLDKILNNDSEDLRVPYAHLEIIHGILGDFEDDMTIKKHAEALKEYPNLTLSNILIARLRLAFESGSWTKVKSVCAYDCCLDDEARSEILKFLLSKHYKYCRNFKWNSDAHKESKKQGRKEWFETIKHYLVRSDASTIVDTAKMWFPILHKNEPIQKDDDEKRADAIKNNDDWIMDTIVPTLGGYEAFRFGMYLSNYFVFDRDEEKDQFSQRYLDFIETDLGIEWKILPEKS